ncbi:MAG: ROK family protein [Kineosporiaceae bacterium]
MGPRPAATVPSDQAGLRRANLSLVLRHLLAAGPRSRAAVADEVGLTKATVSSLVADLLDRRLVVEGRADRRVPVGRPGRLLHVASGSVVGVGATVTADAVDVLARDLSYRDVARARVVTDVRAAGAERAMALLGGAVSDVLALAVSAGWHVAGLTVAVPGLVDVPHGAVVVAPNLGWRDQPLVKLLSEGLDQPDPPIGVDNDATLAAVAEHACGVAAGTADLVTITGDVGVGVGVVLDGRLVRGAVGFGGELGHAPLASPDRVCGCGRRGCWETEVGLGALLRTAATGPGDPLLDQGLDVPSRLRTVRERAQAGDERAGAAVAAVAAALGRGAAVLVNLVNPSALVLGGYFGVLADLLVPTVVRALDRDVLAPHAGGCTVHGSTLGLTAPAVGGAIEALRRVVDDPTLVPLSNE